MAEIDLGNVMGPQGEPGSQWYYGTAITGTNSTGTIFSNSGISKAVINDKYLNTSTSNVYTCTVGGAASVAKWAYIGNIKGEKGNTGPAGATGQVDKDTPIEFTEASTESDINSGESLSTMFGKLKKSIKTFRTSIGTLSSLKTTVKNSLVNAINELKNGLGTVGELDTTAKDSVVNAVNELKSNVDTLNNSVDTLNGDLKNKIDVENIANNLTTTASGKVLDARMGKTLNDSILTKVSDISGSFASVSEFVQYVANLNSMSCSGKFSDTGGWTPLGGWVRFFASRQNSIGGSYSVDIQLLILKESNVYAGWISGTSGDYSVKWYRLYSKTEYYELGSVSGITCHVWSTGQIITIETSGGLSSNIDAWNQIKIGTLPSLLRPPTQLVFPVSGISSQYGICIVVGYDGVVAIMNRSNSKITASNQEIFTVCTYASSN